MNRRNPSSSESIGSESIASESIAFESIRPVEPVINFKPVKPATVKPAKQSNSSLMRIFVTFICMLVVTGVGVFALHNDLGQYGVIDEQGPIYAYIDGPNYEGSIDGYQEYYYYEYVQDKSHYDYNGYTPAYHYGYDSQSGQVSGYGYGEASYYQGPYYDEDTVSFYAADASDYEEYYNYGGYIGYAPTYADIQPLQILTGTVVQYAGNPVTSRAQLLSAISSAPTTGVAANEFFAIAIGNGAGAGFMGFDVAGNVPIDGGGRNIILTTYGTNLVIGENPAFGTGVAAQELRQGSNARHFTISGGASLMLVNIVIDGRTAGGARPTGTATHGGISVTNGRLVMETNSVITNNRSSTDGGGVHVNGTNARFYLNAGRIGAPHTNPTHAYVPGIGYTVRHPASVNYTVGAGVAVGVANTWVTNTAPILLDRNHATRAGGGVGINNGGTFIMNGGMIIINSGRGRKGGNVWSNAWSAGGVALVGQGSRAYVHGGYIRGNWSAHNAGGVLVRNDSLGGSDPLGPQFHFHGGSIEYNRSSRNDSGGTGGGGGVTLTHGAHFYMYDGAYIQRNFAVTTGGGVRMRDGAYMTMHGGTIRNNNGGGGATGTSFSGGGGIFMESISRGAGGDTITLTMYGGRVSYNTSRDTRTTTTGGGMPVAGGGGIFLRGGDLHLRGSGNKYIEGNTSGSHGGGIIWVDSGWMHVDGRATRTGAPRPQYANTGMVSISGNHAGYVYNIGVTTVPAPGPGTRADRHGGGIYIQGDYFSAPFFTINNNSATGNGGGVFTRNTVTINGGGVSGNFAGGLMERPATHGAGARAAHGLDSAIGLGGGIQIAGAGSLNATAVNIDDNSAGQHGGGVNIGGAGAVSFIEASVSHNTVRNVTGNGGGLNITGSGAITATDSTIDGNDTGAHGAGINAGGTGNVIITNTSISDNIIRNIGDGSGIRNMGNLMTTNNSNIDDNIGAQRGGGVFMSAGTLTITDTTIDGNDAGLSGGGVFMGRGTAATGATFNMNGNSSISDNEARGSLITQGGGGVFIEGAGGAGNAGLIAANTFNMNYGVISANVAIRGGGVFISGSHRTGAGNGNVNGGTFAMANGNIIGNNAVCATFFDSNATPTGGDGGGVFMDGGVRIGAAGLGLAHGSGFTMANGVIADNTAVGNGGGVFLDRGQGAVGTSDGAYRARGAEFIMNNGSIRGNEAGYGTGNTGDGGGVFIHGTTLYSNHAIHLDSVSRFYLFGGNIYGNIAENGGGVYVQGGRRVGAFDAHSVNAIARGGRLTIGSGTGYIRGNTAFVNGGGVYLAGGHRMGSGNGGYAHGGRLLMEGGTVGGMAAGYENDVFNNPYANRAVNGGGIFAGGALDQSTGARIAHSSDLNILGGSIIHNIAYERGGGVHLSGNILPADTSQSPYAPIFNLNFGGIGTIAYNIANRGGGVYVGGGHRTPSVVPAAGVIHGAELIISGTGFVGPGNRAVCTTSFNALATPDGGDGGGVYVSGGVRAGGIGGGATGGILRFAGNGTVQGNSAERNGGGVALRPGRDIGTGGDYPHPHSHPGALLSMNGGHILGNTAAGDGGGLWIPNICDTYTVVPFFSDFGNLAQSLVTQPNTVRNNRMLTNVNINGNTATGNIGAIPPPAPANYTGFGGGIWLGRGLEMYLNNSRVLSNNAGRNGGSVFLHAGIVGDPGFNTLTMLGGYLSGSAQRGGGVYVSGGVAAVNGAVFIMRNNATVGMPVDADPGLPRGTASIDGGGVYVQGGTTAINAGRFYMLSGSVGAANADGTRRGNIAHRNGGGVFLGLAQNDGAQNAVLLFNRNFDGTNNPMPTGPRSFVGNDADGGIVGNSAEGRGGGIFIPGGFPPITFPANTSINFNHARYGGGAWIGPSSSVTLETGGVIRGNSAVYDGGGMFVSGGPIAATAGASFTMHGGIIGGPGTVDGNHAQRGGGVFVGHGSTGTANNHAVFTFNNNGDIRGNRARLGGGVFISDGHTDVGVSGSAGDINLYDPYLNVAPTENNSPFINIAPASAFLGSGGRFYMNGGHIRYNIAGNDDDAQNIIVGNGGGVWIANYAYFYPTSVSFNNNRAIGIMDEYDMPIGGMGGAIFTMRYEYQDPLTRVTPNWSGAPETFSYSNIIMSGVSNFSANSAVLIELPPVNAAEAIANTLFGTTSQPAVAALQHPINNFDINFMHSPEGMFHFFSTDERIYREVVPYIYLLDNAQFILFRTIDPHVTDAMFDADPDGRTVIFDSNGVSLSNLWVEIPFACGNYTAVSSGTEISFNMDARFTYQLVQVMSPPNFQIPMGQWQITRDVLAAVGTNPFNVVIIGTMTPAGLASTDPWFPTGTVHPLVPEDNIWYFGNWPSFELPMTGGVGVNVFVISGSATIVIAVLAALVLVSMKKAAAKKSASV